MNRLRLWIPAMIVLIASGCAGPSAQTGATATAPTNDAEAFLKWSMNKMAAIDSYQSDSTWTMSTDAGKGPATDRTISYVKPNKFKVVASSYGGRSVMSSISDGKRLVEFTPGLAGQSYPAPDSFAASESMYLKHPMFCGSLLYEFFGGSSNYAELATSQRKPEFGAKEKAEGGEEAQVVKFYGAGMYGNAEALIGATTGFVYRLKYDSEPLLKAVAENPAIAGNTVTKIPKNMDVLETFKNIQTGKPIAPEYFAAVVPKDIEIQEAPQGPETKPPVPLGSPAPDFEVTNMDGKKVKLSSFRGKPVLIDFWATWCPPCREGLPITNRMHEKFKAAGLQVLTISDEDRAVVDKFIKKEKYTFPSYLDPLKSASKAYDVQAIPTLVIIDAKGNLSSYSMGLEPESAILEKLKKVGLG